MSKALVNKLTRDPESAWTLTRKVLDEALDYIDKKYYNSGEKPLTDDVFDRVMEIYGERFPKSVRLKKVGAKVGNKRAEVPLPVPMSSLTKIKTEQKIALFAKKYPGPYFVSDKEDGMAGEIVYTGGKPNQVFTRGDGTKGQDISHVLANLKIPKRISVKDRFIVRVEILAAVDTFDKHLHEDAGGKFTAVRNAAGGIILKLPTSKDYAEYANYTKHLSVMAFRILEGKNSKKPISEQFKYLESLGFEVPPYKTFKTIDQASLSAHLAKRIKASRFEIDGLVVEQDKYYPVTVANPKHAVSFKENSVASMVEVVCTGVTWEVSRTGKIKPVINIKPTRIGGVTVSNFTGHNAFYIMNGYLKGSKEDKARTKPRPIGKGAVLQAVRSGQVIPYVVSVLKGAKKPDLPNMNYSQKGVEFYADDAKDSTKRIKMFEHFFTSIGVDGFKANTIKKFFDSGYTRLQDFLDLQIEDFEAIDGLGKRKGQEYLTSLRKALDSLTFSKLANASGMFVGFSNRLADIEAAYPDVHRWDLSKAQIRGKIKALDGFNELANTFAESLPKFQKFVTKYGFKIKKVKQTVVSSKLKNIRVTYTGVRDHDLTARIAENGGVVQSMRKDTNIVLVKELGFSSSTVEKAEDQGIPVMTVEAFRKKYKV
jgi:NAD-dependent DNA ligase